MLKYLLLGLLAKESRHGYELRAALDELLGATAAVNEGQIYATLQRLERDGLVTHDVVAQDSVPAKKINRITESGVKDLRRWIETATSRARLKDDLFVRVTLASLIAPDDLPGLLIEQRRALVAELADLVAAHRVLPEANPTALLLDAAIRHAQADVQWIDRCDELLNAPR